MRKKQEIIMKKRMIVLTTKKRVRVVAGEDRIDTEKGHLRKGGTRHWGTLVARYGDDKSLVKFTNYKHKVVVEAFDNNLIEEVSL